MNVVDASQVAQVFDAFGWKIVRHVLPPGGTMITHSSAPVPRDRAPNLAMYVRGRATAVTDGVQHEDRTPGLYTGERPDHPRGTSVVTAVEETEFWCFNHTHNRRALPDLLPIRLQPGEGLWLPERSRLFVMSGSAGFLEGPRALYAAQPMQLEASTPFYAFMIAEAR